MGRYVARIFGHPEFIESKILAYNSCLFSETRTCEGDGRNSAQFSCNAYPRPRGCATPSATNPGDYRIAAFLAKKFLEFFHLLFGIDVIGDFVVGNQLDVGILLS